MSDESSINMESNSSNDLGERLMNLPFELKQRILFSLTPKERRRLRLVNKAMLDVVDASLSDVQKMEINFPQIGSLNMAMTTINPYNGTSERHWHERIPSFSLPFLLKWTGAQLTTLELIIRERLSETDSRLDAVYQIFDALNSENTCPKLKILSLFMEPFMWDYSEIIFSELVKYFIKRQLQMMGTDRPIPFLHSLSLTTLSKSTPDETSGVNPLQSEKRSKFLQDILDQCHGLKELDVDSLLVQKKLPIVALHYPTTLTHLKSARLNGAPGALQTIIKNCPNLQIVDLEVGLLRDDMAIHTLASLSDLRKLEVKICPTTEDRFRIILQCLGMFKDHSSGASIGHPRPLLRSITLNCFEGEYKEYLSHRIILSGASCCITSLYLTCFMCYKYSPYGGSVEALFKALDFEDACPNLRELNITSCELVNSIEASLETPEEQLQMIFYDNENIYPDGVREDYRPSPSPHVYGILNDLLAFVTKRQLAVQLEKPFLHSLSIRKADCDCKEWMGLPGTPSELPNELERVRNTVQEILNQCHGLEEIYVESLENFGALHPNEKKGRELIELVPLRFPTALKKLNGVQLD